MKFRRFIFVISIYLDGFTILILIAGAASAVEFHWIEFRPIALWAIGRKAFQWMIGCN
jgi:hypothetical protein